MSSSSSSSDGVLDDMVIAMAQEAINYLREEAESSASHTRQSPIERNRLAAHECLVQDYFCETMFFNEIMFCFYFLVKKQIFK
ncbi:hypothetical protein HanPI659440_Chr05g0210681 [Helianthus annuus]|nr:hypothetical protein HanPI659440_Chr05g0210681 [Helianthus annuus]